MATKQPGMKLKIRVNNNNTLRLILTSLDQFLQV